MRVPTRADDLVPSRLITRPRQYSHPPPLSPSHLSDQHASSSSRPLNGAPSSTSLGVRSPSKPVGHPSGGGASSSTRSSLPWHQPPATSSTCLTRQSAHLESGRSLRRASSTDWTDDRIDYRTLPAQPGARDSTMDIDRPRQDRFAHPHHQNGFAPTTQGSSQSMPPPPTHPPYTSRSTQPQHPGLPRLPPPTAGPSSSSAGRALSPSKPAGAPASKPHPHLDRPGNSTRSHPSQPPSGTPSDATFTAPPLPQLRAKSPVAPALLTASQKKANHIASEQKRCVTCQPSLSSLVNRVG